MVRGIIEIKEKRELLLSRDRISMKATARHFDMPQILFWHQ